MRNIDNLSLLSNVLDCLDRLFDGESTVVDVHAVIYATAFALPTHKHFTLLREAAASLEELIRLGLPEAVAREQGVTRTNALRIALAAEVGLS